MTITGRVSALPHRNRWIAVEKTQPPQDGGLNAISKNHLLRDMMDGRAKRKAKNFFTSVLLFIVCCVWVFWFGVLTWITDDPKVSGEQALLLCMLAMAVVPFGFVAARLIR
jgi:hypothetical protein